MASCIAAFLPEEAIAKQPGLRQKVIMLPGPETLPVLIILHQEQSTPGRIGWMLQGMGYGLDIRRPALGDVLPSSLAQHSGAVIFGGPMSANDADDFIKREIDWIGVPLKEAKPFLGVCLGAQMLSKHLGGTVAPHPDGLVEIGYCPLTPVAGGCSFSTLPGRVYQWHREGLTLPRGAECQARSEVFDNQAFRYGPAAFGIQFHPEVTRLMMHRWTVKAAQRLTLPGAQPADEQLEQQLIYDRPVEQWLQVFLAGWLKTA